MWKQESQLLRKSVKKIRRVRRTQRLICWSLEKNKLVKNFLKVSSRIRNVIRSIQSPLSIWVLQALHTENSIIWHLDVKEHTCDTFSGSHLIRFATLFVFKFVYCFNNGDDHDYISSFIPKHNRRKAPWRDGGKQQYSISYSRETAKQERKETWMRQWRQMGCG